MVQSGKQLFADWDCAGVVSSAQYLTKMLIYEGSYAQVNISTRTVLSFENELSIFLLNNAKL